MFTYLDIGLYSNTTVLFQYPCPAVIGVMYYKYRILKQWPTQEPKFPPSVFYPGYCLPLCFIQHLFQFFWNWNATLAFFSIHNSVSQNTRYARAKGNLPINNPVCLLDLSRINRMSDRCFPVFYYYLYPIEHSDTSI